MDEGRSWSGRERNCSYVNLGNGRFANASFASGLDFADDGRAVAVVDWEGDGDLDLWLANRTGPQLRFMRNSLGRDAHFVAFRLRGTRSNRDAIGARVELEASGHRLSRTVVAGDGYLSQSSKWLHFGLGEVDEIDRVTIHWPGGEPEVLAGLEVDRRYRIEQGTGRAVAVAPRRVELPEPTTAASAPTASTGVLLKVPLQIPPSVTKLVRPQGERGRHELINLWAHWCAPCIEELSELADRYGELHGAGLEIHAVSVDDEKDHSAAAKLFDERIATRMAGPAFAQQPITAELRETLDAILKHVLGRHDEITLPTSLLIDDRDVLQMIYLGPVSADRLLADLEAHVESPVKGSRRSLYPGRWYFRTHRDLNGLAGDLRKRGRKGDARFYYALSKLGELRRSE